MLSDPMLLLEQASVLASLLYILLAARKYAICWLFGGLGALGFMVLYYHHALWFQSALNGIYVAMAVIGFGQWKRDLQNADVPFERYMEPKWHLFIMAIAALLGLLVWLTREAQWFDVMANELVLMDFLILYFSVVATWMSVKHVTTMWVYWLLINVASAVLVLLSGLYYSAALFAIYVAFSAYGLYVWYINARKHHAKSFE